MSLASAAHLNNLNKLAPIAPQPILSLSAPILTADPSKQPTFHTATTSLATGIITNTKPFMADRNFGFQAIAPAPNAPPTSLANMEGTGPHNVSVSIGYPQLRSPGSDTNSSFSRDSDGERIGKHSRKSREDRDLIKCPTPGCDGRGHVSGNYAHHRRYVQIQ